MEVRESRKELHWVEKQLERKSAELVESLCCFKIALWGWLYRTEFSLVSAISVTMVQTLQPWYEGLALRCWFLEAQISFARTICSHQSIQIPQYLTSAIGKGQIPNLCSRWIRNETGHVIYPKFVGENVDPLFYALCRFRLDTPSSASSVRTVLSRAVTRSWFSSKSHGDSESGSRDRTGSLSNNAFQPC
jgi:hypothetical protein